MRITIDTEKDSKEDIRETIKILQKIVGEREVEEPKPAMAKPANVKLTSIPIDEEEEDKKAEELLSILSKPKQAQKKEKEELVGVPESVKEAYDIAEDLETY